jgi:hypothetical protein
MTKQQVVFERIDGDQKVFDFKCPYTAGCLGDNGESFGSYGWNERQHAVARGQQHIEEHETGKVMPELAEFWAEHGLTSETAGRANLPPDYSFDKR